MKSGRAPNVVRTPIGEVAMTHAPRKKRRGSAKGGRLLTADRDWIGERADPRRTGPPTEAASVHFGTELARYNGSPLRFGLNLRPRRVRTLRGGAICFANAFKIRTAARRDLPDRTAPSLARANALPLPAAPVRRRGYYDKI